jgi:HK97 family phage major capsid protein
VDELKKLLESLQRAFEEFKSANDQRIKQLEAKGHADPLLEQKVNKANDDIGRITAAIEEVKAQKAAIEEIKTALARPGMGSPALSGKEEEAQRVLQTKQAFVKALRYGRGSLSPEEKAMFSVSHLSPEERKILSVSDDPNGGYLIPVSIEQEILRNLANINAVRGLADVRQITVGNTFEQRRRTAGITATRTGERGANPASGNPTFGMLKIEAQEYRALCDATSQEIEDAAYDIEGLVQGEASEAFANAEGDDFLNGNGVNRPRGMLSYPTGTSDGQVEQVVSGTAAAIADTDGQSNGLLTMMYKLKAAYAKNGSFLLNRLTTGALRKLKDSQKNYIWQPGLGSEPPTVFGRPYYEDDNMPVEGANNLVIIFGDFKKFYKVVDKMGISVTRDPFTAKPDVQWLFRKRTGGDVSIFEAAKILKCST